MIAIETKFLGPTNTRGSRIVATTTERKPRRMTIDCASNVGIEDNHKAAARALIHKLGWDDTPYGDWIMGGTIRGYVFVCDSKHGYDRL